MRQGFSMIELAILLVIAGGLAAAATMMGSAYLDSAEVRTTRDNIKTVERAITAYVRANNRLPCPADETVDPSSIDYGKESSGLGTCTSAATATGEVKRGVVPFETLGISKSMAYDAWGNRLSYFVDRRMTVENATELWPAANPNIGDITIKDLAGGVRTDKAVYSLLSTGAKAHGSVSRSGTIQRLSDPSVQELANTDVNAAGVPQTPNSELFQGMIGAGIDAKPFDDIVAYKRRANLESSSVNLIQNCTAQSVPWSEGINSCVGSVADLPDGTVVIVSDITGPTFGSVTVSCDAGVLTQSGADCETVTADCSPATVNWTVDAACAGSVGSTVLNGGVTGSITNTTGGRTGSATFTCSNGTFTVNPGAVCGNNCTAGTANWTGTASCTAAYGALNHGANVTISDSTAPGLGNVTMTCTNGAPPSQSAATCTPAGCGATSLSWGAGCSASVTTQSSGYSAGVTNAASGYAGTGTAVCTDGAWSVTSPVCNAHCPAQAVNWTVGGSSCTQSLGALSHGAGSALSDTTPNHTGSVNVTCNNGTLNQSGAACAASCDAQLVTWTQGANTCRQNVGALAHGVSQALTWNGITPVTLNTNTITPSGRIIGTWDDFRGNSGKTVAGSANDISLLGGKHAAASPTSYTCGAGTTESRNNWNWGNFDVTGSGWCNTTGVQTVSCQVPGPTVRVYTQSLTPSGRYLGTHDDFRGASLRTVSDGARNVCQFAGYQNHAFPLSYACATGAVNSESRSNGNWNYFNWTGQGWCQTNGIEWIDCVLPNPGTQGSVTVTCNNGTLNQSSALCN